MHALKSCLRVCVCCGGKARRTGTGDDVVFYRDSQKSLSQKSTRSTRSFCRIQ